MDNKNKGATDSSNVGRNIGQDLGQTHTSYTSNDDVGTGERYNVASADHQGILFSNDKLTFDLTREAEMNGIHRRSDLAEKLDNISVQALQNAVETSNMVGKQAVRHGDLAIDRQWNIDEQAAFVKEIINDPAIEDAIKVKIIEAIGSSQK